jgi:hypothetical protein
MGFGVASHYKPSGSTGYDFFNNLSVLAKKAAIGDVDDVLLMRRNRTQAI